MRCSRVLVGSSSLAGILTLLACGSSGGGTSSFSSGLPAGAMLTSLDDADVGRLCDAISRSIASIPKGPACQVSAFEMAHSGGVPEGTEPPVRTDATIRMACADDEAACMKSSSSPIQPPALCLATTDWKSGCTATVHQLESCVSDAIVRWNDMQSARARSVPPCSSLTIADLESPVSYPQSAAVPVSCKMVEETCRKGLSTPD